MSDALPPTHRVLEPQLVSALGWACAGTLLMLLGPIAGVVPPELVGALGLGGGALVIARPWLPRLLARRYRWLLVDRARFAALLAAGAMLLGSGIAGLVGARALPSCPALLGTLDRSDLASGAMLAVVAAIEPALLHRELVRRYLWSVPGRGYLPMWAVKLGIPSIALGLGLLAGWIGDGIPWQQERAARELLAAIEREPDARGVSQRVRTESRRLDDREQAVLAEEAVRIASCQADDALLERLLGVAQNDAAAQLELQQGLRKHAIAAYLRRTQTGGTP